MNIKGYFQVLLNIFILSELAFHSPCTQKSSYGNVLVLCIFLYQSNIKFSRNN